MQRPEIVHGSKEEVPPPRGEEPPEWGPPYWHLRSNHSLCTQSDRVVVDKRNGK
ncbi:hypothetical protein LguiA_014263 [Lonicera macranthoides]